MSGRRLLPPAPDDLRAALEAFPALVDRAAPLAARHRAALPRGIAELSGLLTADRDDLPPDYLGRPAYLAAYLRYFLPWNLLRQGRLLAGLEGLLGLRDAARIVDVGAGPVTFLLALWLARPDLRTRPLVYTAEDRTAAPVRAGRALFAALAPEAPWALRTRRTGGGRRRQVPATADPADLLVLANVLNEIPAAGGERGGDPAARLEPWFLDWERRLAPAGRVLIVEPGIREAGRLVATVRAAALARGWSVLGPCPHAGDCPQPGVGRGPWCHFAFPAGGAPDWLARLSRKAGLPKERASLSFLLLDRGGGEADLAVGPLAVRVVSDPLALPGNRRGVYGCSAEGLVLLETGTQPPPARGDLVGVRPPARRRRDRKSGALVIPPPPSPPPGGRTGKRD